MKNIFEKIFWILIVIFLFMIIFYPVSITILVVFLTNHGYLTTPDENYHTWADKILAIAWFSWLGILFLIILLSLFFGKSTPSDGDASDAYLWGSFKRGKS